MLIARPPCPNCGATMMLARIAPDGPGFELRSFECPNCEHTFAERVAGTDQRAVTLPNSARCADDRNAR
jgi:transposase-like protein